MMNVHESLVGLLASNADHVPSEQEQEQEQEQSSLYIVHNKFLITSSDSVETKEDSDLFI